MPNRRIANDTRGWISELLAKYVKNDVHPDTELSKKGVDKEQFLNLLTIFGDIEPDHNYDYRGSSRSGYLVQPGIDSCGVLLKPLTLADLVKSDFWNHRFYQAEEYEWQPTLFQPVGGMDQIWRYGFLQKGGVEELIRYGQQVVKVQNFIMGNGQRGVQVYFQSAGGPTWSMHADWCISTIPLPILAKIDNNFDEKYKKAIAGVKFEPTVKVGWQTNSRFWETQDEMYGGISYTTDPITQIWYPSWAYFKEKGILTGAYNYDTDAIRYGEWPLRRRLDEAMNGLKKVHPKLTANDVPIDLGLSIAWQNVSWQLGGWAKDWGCEDQDKIPDTLLNPEGRFWVAGDQVSYISGWQEGAVRSACHVVEGITRKEGREVKCGFEREKVEGVAPAASIRKAPGIRRRTRGLP